MRQPGDPTLSLGSILFSLQMGKTRHRILQIHLLSLLTASYQTTQ